MSEAPRAALVAVGDELLAGAHPDSNSPELARRLVEAGFHVDCVQILPDDEERIAGAVGELAAERALVIVTGGLGPTLDDVTRHAIARATDCALEEDPAAMAELEAWFDRRGADMPAANRRQALFPRGATIVPNRAGTAPGFRLRCGAGHVVALPGPPREMRVVFEEEIVPWLERTGSARRPTEERRFHLFGLSESVFAEEAGAWMERDAEPRMGCSVKNGVLSVVLRAKPGGEASLVERAAAFRERFGVHLFSEEDARLEHVLGAELLARGVTIATAESCTGGLAASLLTRVPGISEVFREGFVTYAFEAKTRQLGVPAELLERTGAVSDEVAAAMASGAARASGARLTLAITGVAGPGGGSDAKPVGLVWFATSVDGRVETVSRRFPPGERNWIRSLAARMGLFLCLGRLWSAD